ncbi:MAG: heavy metal-binding domain-containing protein, partial [Clostridia bacterium]|nr:heavy metal-binding domain-containing protein [Clostridia bacterium]
EAYLGTVYGTNIYTVGGVLGGGLANQEKLFGAAFADAKKKMYDRAVALGGDAVVGMQTIMTSPGGMNEMIVIATGTAVALKKEDE